MSAFRSLIIRFSTPVNFRLRTRFGERLASDFEFEQDGRPRSVWLGEGNQSARTFVIQPFRLFVAGQIHTQAVPVHSSFAFTFSSRLGYERDSSNDVAFEQDAGCFICNYTAYQPYPFVFQIIRVSTIE